jgi:outer membrane protein
MKRVSQLLFVAILAVVGFVDVAKAAPPTKIGYVDLEKALNDVEDGKKAKDKLKVSFDERQKKLDASVADFKKKKDNYDKQAALLSADKKDQQEKELEKQFIELQTLAAQLQQEIAAEEAKLTKPIFDRFANILQSMGDEGSYAVILEKNQSAILYAPDSLNLTSELVRNYNDGKGKSATPATPTKTPTPPTKAPTKP